MNLNDLTVNKFPTHAALSDVFEIDSTSTCSKLEAVAQATQTKYKNCVKVAQMHPRDIAKLLPGLYPKQF